jgi:gamma-butyrobetaine dioxygenase
MRIEFTERCLRLTREGHESAFPAVWLYDNRPDHRDHRTGQRLVDITGLPADPQISRAELGPDAVQIQWTGETNHSSFRLEWLLAHCLCDQHAPTSARTVTTWGREEISRLCWMDHSAVSANRAARREWLRAIALDGLAFLRDVPAQDGYVREFASILGYVTETNYGRLFDVRAVDDPNNLAYTPFGLGVHTDNPYRDPVPGFQILLCLTPSSEGGESIFVDGFRVAEELKAEDPGAFHLLTSTPVMFAFQNSTAQLEAGRPMIQLSARGELQAVHYNNRALAPLRIAADKVPDFYRAYRSFAALLRDARCEVRLKLRSGDLVVFDNHRILHGRTAFTGARHLQGCYINRDGLFSNLAVLERNGAS